jgi:alpha-L-fucosidase 2
MLLSIYSAAFANNRLHYVQPAETWTQALPLGNGRMGVMVFGGIETETLVVSELTLWSGEYNAKQNKPFGKERLDSLRQLFFNGNIAEGNRIAGENLIGDTQTFGSNVPFGNIKIAFDHPEGKISGYERELNIENAVQTVRYSVGKINYRREYFASNPAQIVAARFLSDKPQSVSLRISLDLLREAEIQTIDNQMIIKGKVHFPKHGAGGVNFCAVVAVKIRNGKIQSDNQTIEVKNADVAELYFDLRTDYKNPDYEKTCMQTIEKAFSSGYETLKNEHIADYFRLFNRVELSLGQDIYGHLPTDIRQQQMKNGVSDPALVALFFQYARYLLIAASRENSPLPANLQGIWNDNLACNMRWTNDYHLDINTQQNYWLANVGNLPECNIPLFNYIRDLSEQGEATAREVYGCRGWTAHTTANAWGYTAPSASIVWGLFPTAGSWIASHLGTHFRFTRDTAFLQTTAYPLLKGNAQFLLDYLTEDPSSGYLMTGPSISPENWFTYQGENFVASMMPTCDRALVYEILSSTLQASRILNVDAAFADSLQTALNKLPPYQLRANGGLREWFDDYEEAEPNHRHTSHLLGLYPFSQITTEQTPGWAQAATITLQNKLSLPGWEDTEWSRANLICFFARLKQAENAYKNVVALITGNARENLMTVSPQGIAGAPSDIFAFDGNIAGAAGIAEMLLQSYNEQVYYLPALPKEWENGYFKGLCVEGGKTVDLYWENGEIMQISH